MPYIGTSPSNGVRRVHTYTATASQTTFTGASNEGVTLSYADTNYLDVFQNGVLLGSADYTSTSGTSVVLAQGASADDLIVIVVYDVFSVADTVSKTNGGSFDSAVTMSSTLAVTGNQTNSGNLTVSGAFTSQGIDDNADAVALTIDSSERIIIGDTDTTNAHVNGDDLVIGNTSSGKRTGISIVSATDQDGSLLWSDGNDSNVSGQLVYSHNDNSMRFYTSTSQQMMIRTNGAIGVGIDASASYHFYVNNKSGSGVVAYFAATSGTGVYLSNGNSSWTGTSDETLKENITELNKQQSYDNIKNIRAVNFNFKTDSADDVRLGFIAQDWQTNYSECVVNGADNKLGLNYTDTIPVLLSALQKAQEKIEALEARITALENAE
jgi:hypothetical protein